MRFAFTDQWEFPHKPKWSVYCNGELIEGQVRKKLVDRVKEHRVMQYMSEKMANKQCFTSLLLSPYKCTSQVPAEA